MTINSKELEAIIDGVLQPRGFKKRKSAWFRHHPETVLVVDLQKSDYGGQYYVNLGVGFRALNPAEYPREEQCHIRVRLDKVLNDMDIATNTFDLEDRSLPDDRRRLLQIQDKIGKGAQWLEAFSCTNAIVQRLSSDEFLRNRSTILARRFLKIG